MDKVVLSSKEDVKHFDEVIFGQDRLLSDETKEHLAKVAGKLQKLV